MVQKKKSGKGKLIACIVGIVVVVLALSLGIGFKVHHDKVLADEKRIEEKAKEEKAKKEREKKEREKKERERKEREKEQEEDEDSTEDYDDSDDSDASASGCTRDQAVEKAKQYVASGASIISRINLETELKTEGVSPDDAEYAANNCGVDWNEKAYKVAKLCVDYLHYSDKDKIRGYLRLMKFTDAEIDYALNVIGL